MTFFRNQLVDLHMTLHFVKKITNFPFSTLGYLTQPFFATVKRKFVDASLLIINKLMNNTGGNRPILPDFVEQIPDLMKPKYHETYFEQVQDHQLDDEAIDLIERVQIITNNRIIRYGAYNEQEADIRLSRDEIFHLRDVITGLYEALEFRYVQNMWLVVDYLQDYNVSNESRADIDKILDSMARESRILNMPEQQPELWKHTKQRFNREELEVINEYRRKFGLPEA